MPDELRAATQDLNLIKSLLPSLNMTDDFAMDVDREEFQLEDQESNQGGNDLLKQQGKQIAELKAIVGMLTTLILRQEVQLNISKQDTSYVVFINTKEPQSLAHRLHGVGVQWHKLKQEAPDQITSPMRIVMFQHFIEVVQTRFLRMLESPSSKSKPIELGFMQEKDGKIPGLRWVPRTEWWHGSTACGNSARSIRHPRWGCFWRWAYEPRRLRSFGTSSTDSASLRCGWWRAAT